MIDRNTKLYSIVLTFYHRESSKLHTHFSVVKFDFLFFTMDPFRPGFDFISNSVNLFWRMSSTFLGLGGAATVAVVKTDMNKVSETICMLLMFVACLIAIVYMYQVTINGFVRLAINFQHHHEPIWIRILPFIAFVILTRSFNPITFGINSLIYFLPNAVLYIYGHHGIINALMNPIAGGNLPAIAHRRR